MSRWLITKRPGAGAGRPAASAMTTASATGRPSLSLIATVRSAACAAPARQRAMKARSGRARCIGAILEMEPDRGLDQRLVLLGRDAGVGGAGGAVAGYVQDFHDEVRVIDQWALVGEGG